MNKNDPTPAQREAVESNCNRILVIAGPGSGKTRTLVWRMQRLIAEGIDPRRMVAITRTNAAAKEVASRLDDAAAWNRFLNRPPDEPTEEHKPLRLGYVGTLHGYALRELQRHGAVLGYGPRITVLDEEQAEELLREIAKGIGYKGSAAGLRAARLGFNPGGRVSTAEEIAVAQYYKRMRETSTVDFDTILGDFMRLLTFDKNRGVGPMLPPIDHLFVDEFQDSGTIDFEIYDALPANDRFFVGDPDQAIYGFRGGDVAGILRAAEGGWATVKLEGNFRSVPTICKAANALIKHNERRVPKWTLSRRFDVGTVETWSFGGDSTEAEQIALRVGAWIREGYDANEIAILAATNAIAGEIAKTCKSFNVPVREKRWNALPEFWRACRLTVELCANPSNTMIAEQWVKTTGRFHEIMRQARLDGVPFASRLPAAFTQATPETLPQLLAEWQICGRDAIERVEAKLAEMVEPDLAQLAYALAAEVDHVPEVGHGVTVTTIHAAKGREWGTVIIAAAEEGVLPRPPRKCSPAEYFMRIEEQRRLFFVGVTRAKDRLFVSHADHRREPWPPHRIAKTEPSRFIAELA